MVGISSNPRVKGVAYCSVHALYLPTHVMYALYYITYMYAYVCVCVCMCKGQRGSVAQRNGT